MHLRHWLFVILILLVGRMAFFLEPYGISVDESTYLAVAEAWDFYGRPYVDGVDRKPPLLYGLYWAIGKVFGFFNIHAVHFVFFLLTLFICYLCERIARRFPHPPPKGLTAILVAVISSCFSREFIGSNAELAMMPFLIGALGFYQKSLQLESRWRLFLFALLSAALAAIGTATKQVAAFPYAMAVILSCLWLLKIREFKKVAIVSVAVPLGVSFIYALIVFYFWRKGILEDFLQWNLWDNFSYIQDTQNHTQTERPFWQPIVISLGLWPVCWWAYLKIWKRQFHENSEAQLLWLGALIGCWLLIPISGRLFAHYFVPIGIVLALLSASGLVELLKSRTTKWLAVVGLSLSFAINFAITTFRDELQHRVTKAPSFTREVQNRMKIVAEAINEMTEPEDRIAVWGMASQIYLMSQRGSGTRFIPADYASGRMGGLESGARHGAEDVYMKLYLKDLIEKQPQIFVDTASAGVNDYQHFPTENYPELMELLEDQYERGPQIEGFQLWVLKDEDTKVDAPL